MDVRELHIVMGLPACGKTTYVKELAMKNSNGFVNALVIDIDKYLNNYKKDNTLKSWLSDYTPHGITIIDGFFSTQTEVINILNTYMECFKSTTFHSIIIDYWPMNREACLINDRGRKRFKSSEISIRKINIEKPDSAFIVTKLGVNNVLIVTHETVSKDISDIWAEENGCFLTKEIPYESNKEIINCIVSKTWTGGTIQVLSATGRTTYNNQEEPVDFEELDNFLDRVCPNIKIMEYKKLYRTLVVKKARPINDYYVKGYEYYWSIEVKALYDFLISNGIIEAFD